MVKKEHIPPDIRLHIFFAHIYKVWHAVLNILFYLCKASLG